MVEGQQALEEQQRRYQQQIDILTYKRAVQQEELLRLQEHLVALTSVGDRLCQMVENWLAVNTGDDPYVLFDRADLEDLEHYVELWRQVQERHRRMPTVRSLPDVLFMDVRPRSHE